MSSSQSSGPFVATKSTTSSFISAPPTQAPAIASSGNDPQRRSGGGGPTFGSNLSSRNNLASPRSGQAGRTNHRNRRKPGATASEEIAAESQVHRYSPPTPFLPLPFCPTTRYDSELELTQNVTLRIRSQWGHAIDARALRSPTS